MRDQFNYAFPSPPSTPVDGRKRRLEQITDPVEDVEDCAQKLLSYPF